MDFIIIQKWQKSNNIQNPPDVRTSDIMRGINSSSIPVAHKSGRQNVWFLVKAAIFYHVTLGEPFTLLLPQFVQLKRLNIFGGRTSSGVAGKEKCGLGLLLTQVL